MTEVERALLELAGDVAWPPTPEPSFRLPARGRRELRRPVLAALALALAGLAIAFAVPAARSAILHFFRIGGARIERVRTLPPVRERPLAASLGRPVSRAAARRALGAPVRLPAALQLHLSSSGIVSALVATSDGPVLASEFRSVPAVVLVKKVAASGTRIETASIRPGTTGFWLTGWPHVVLEPAPARLAGNVLLWDDGRATYRLEGRRLRLATALEIARRMGR
ncbi:MAG TPA: hypothetical protein VF186_05320 [Gaiellaceae bacterium]|jgi:hypothetical protein